MPADMGMSIVDQPGADAYPIAAFTYQLAYQNMNDRGKATTLTNLLWWELHEGQQYAESLDYAPLPAAVVQKAEAQVRSITVGGQPAFSGN
jgi:phosphate transport system substrate-binding protein